MDKGTKLWAVSKARDPETAIREVADRLGKLPSALRVVFVAPGFDRERTAKAIQDAWGDSPVVGCTAADAPGAPGLSDATVTAFTLPADAFEVAIAPIVGLESFDPARALAVSDRLHAAFGTAPGQAPPAEFFGMLLVDGLSLREEVVASSLQTAFAGIPIFGGSAGAGGMIPGAAVYMDSAFVSDVAALVLVRSRKAFRVFKTQHVRAGGRALVVTRAEIHSRRILELDGRAPLTAYAAALGLAESDVTPAVLASHPLVLRVGDDEFLRAVHDVAPDGTMRFFCAIEEGLVLRVGEPGDMAADLADRMDQLDRDLGGLRLVIGCDCMLRRIEGSQEPLQSRLAEVFARHPIASFSTFGEQVLGMHVNQTFTGVAIGAFERDAA